MVHDDAHHDGAPVRERTQLVRWQMVYPDPLIRCV